MTETRDYCSARNFDRRRYRSRSDMRDQCRASQKKYAASNHHRVEMCSLLLYGLPCKATQGLQASIRGKTSAYLTCQNISNLRDNRTSAYLFYQNLSESLGEIDPRRILIFTIILLFQHHTPGEQTAIRSWNNPLIDAKKQCHYQCVVGRRGAPRVRVIGALLHK